VCYLESRFIVADSFFPNVDRDNTVFIYTQFNGYRLLVCFIFSINCFIHPFYYTIHVNINLVRKFNFHVNRVIKRMNGLNSLAHR
jgi:hypothetical protein